MVDRTLKDALEDNVLTLLCWDIERAPVIAKQITAAVLVSTGEKQLAAASLFSTRQYQRLAMFALDHIAKYGKPPRGHLRDYLEKEIRHRDGQFLRNIIDNMEKLHPTLQGEFVLDELDKFIANRKLMLRMDASYDALNNDDLTAAVAVFDDVRTLLKRGIFDYVDIASLDDRDIPDQPWLVKNWIPSGGNVTSIYGEGATGKTTLVLQLMAATAVGRDWLGMETATAKSYAVLCEDPKDVIERRLKAVLHRQNRTTGWMVADQMRIVARKGEMNALMVFDHLGRGMLTPFYFQVRDEVLAFDAKLVVFDTLTDVFSGNQNDANQIRQFITIALGGLARDIEGAVVLLGHPSRDGMKEGTGYSGNVQWHAAPRGLLSLERKKLVEGEEPGSERPRVLKRLKANYAEGDELQIELHWDEGILTRHGREEEQPGRADAAEVFLKLLKQFIAQGRPVSASGHSSANYAPTLFAGHPDSQGWSKAQFTKAMNKLFSDDVIIQRPYGKYKSKQIELTEPDHQADQPASSDQRVDGEDLVGGSSGVPRWWFPPR